MKTPQNTRCTGCGGYDARRLYACLSFFALLAGLLSFPSTGCSKRAAACPYEDVSAATTSPAKGFENVFEFDGDVRRAETDFETVFSLFVRQIQEAFPEVREQDFWQNRKEWRFGVDFEKGNWAENVACNVHSPGRPGTEAVSPSYVLRNRELMIDYHFFFAPAKGGKRETIRRAIDALACGR